MPKAYAIDKHQNPVLRFAPSPNGELHLGHALSALTNYRQARAMGGTFMLRIEDLDIGRSRSRFIDGIMRDLDWLGLTWPTPVLYQSTRLDAYRDAAAKLSDLGLLYPCFATRSEIRAAADPTRRDPDGAVLYPCLHKAMTAEESARRRRQGQPFALRLDMSRAIALARQKSGHHDFSFLERNNAGTITRVAANPARWGDAVLVRKDVDASYHLAVVVDDAFQGISHVTRGADLRLATDIHILLQILLDFDHPVYHHHRLLTDETGRKLAKRGKDKSLRALREAGHTPNDIMHMIGLD